MSSEITVPHIYVWFFLEGKLRTRLILIKLFITFHFLQYTNSSTCRGYKLDNFSYVYNQNWKTAWQCYFRYSMLVSLWSDRGGGPRVVVSTAAFHARVRGSVPGLGDFKETKVFLPHPCVKVSIVGSLRDREVACSASDRQGSNFESCVWRTVSSQSSHHPQEVLLAQFSLYVHKGGLKPESFHFIWSDRLENPRKPRVLVNCLMQKLFAPTIWNALKLRPDIDRLPIASCHY